MRRLRSVLLLVLVSSLGSCQKPPPPPLLVPVRGTVTYRAKPVASARVEFLPETQGETPGTLASAWTGADGSFTLLSHPHGAGARPGHYRVCISLYPGATSIPEVYGDPATSPLRLEVPEGGLTNARILLRD